MGKLNTLAVLHLLWMTYAVLEDNIRYIGTILKTATDKKKLEGGLQKRACVILALKGILPVHVIEYLY